MVIGRTINESLALMGRKYFKTDKTDNKPARIFFFTVLVIGTSNCKNDLKSVPVWYRYGMGYGILQSHRFFPAGKTESVDAKKSPWGYYK